MQTVMYVVILILSIISTFVVFGKLKMIVFGKNTLDLGMAVIGIWFFIFFVCVTIWSVIFVYLGIPILVIGTILLVLFFIFGRKGEQLADGHEDEQATAETIDPSQQQTQQATAETTDE